MKDEQKDIYRVQCIYGRGDGDVRSAYMCVEHPAELAVSATMLVEKRAVRSALRAVTLLALAPEHALRAHANNDWRFEVWAVLARSGYMTSDVLVRVDGVDEPEVYVLTNGKPDPA